jgi:hypothetical protein
MNPGQGKADATTLAAPRRRALRAVALLPVTALARFVPLAALGGCGGSSASPSPSASATRSWKLGFFPTPPRFDAATLLHGVDQWSQRAEVAMIHEELPWTDLLNGMSADAILDRDKVQLVQYLRGKGLKLAFMGDLDDGLSRGQEAPQLRALGRSLTEPAVQQVYRNYLLAVHRKLAPDYLGLGAETNLIRAAAPPALYAAGVQTANATAADLRAAGATEPLMISVQVETAWGLLGGSGTYAGIATDLADFPFATMLGLSSYPYFAFAKPEDIPSDYYSRVLGSSGLPALVAEGGWSSAAVGSIASSPDLQARYVTRHADLLDSIAAVACLQTLYADIDLAAFPAPVPANLPLFVSIGLTDSNFNAKPALAAWDALHARRLA